MMLTIKRLETNPKYSVDDTEIVFDGVTLRIGRQTGNWHPDSKSWHASIHADVTCYDDPMGWAAGLAGWGSTRDEAILAAHRFASSRTLRFPSGWLNVVLAAVELPLK